MDEAVIDPIDPGVADQSTIEKTPDSETESGATTDKENPKNETTNYSGTKHRVKVGDEDLEIDYDELTTGYQKAQASDKKFREASEIRKKVDELLENVKSGDHKNLIKILGKDQARKMAEALLLEEIEYEELPKHEKTIRKLESEKREAEEKLQAHETEKETIKRQQLEHQAAQEIETEIVGAIKESSAKVTPRLVARVAELMESHIISTGQRLPAKQALEYCREEIPKDFFSYVDGLTNEQVLALKKELPKKFLDVLRKDDVKSVLSQASFSKGRSEEKDLSSPEKRKPAKSRRMTTDSWFEQMEKRLGG